MSTVTSPVGTSSGTAEVDRYRTDSGLSVQPDRRQPGPQVYVSNGSQAVH
jgi:hypothetical protein